MLRLVLAFFASLACLSDAGATLVTVPLSGTFDYVFDPDDELGGAIAVGDPFSIAFSYDDSALDFDPGNPTFGSYAPAAFSLAGSLGTVDFTSSSFGQVEIVDADSGSFTSDDFFLRTEVQLGSAQPHLLSIELLAFGGRAVTSDALAGIPFLLSGNPNSSGAWLIGLIQFGYPSDPSGNLSIAGTITSLSDVPEPATALLLAAGLAGLATRRR